MNETDLFGEPVINGHKSVLARTFEYPPFSVLSARDGWWQDRKRQWLALGIKSEVGRGGVTLAPADGQWNLPGDSVPNTAAGGGLDVGQFAAGHAKGPELLSRFEAVPGGRGTGSAWR